MGLGYADGAWEREFERWTFPNRATLGDDIAQVVGDTGIRVAEMGDLLALYAV